MQYRPPWGQPERARVDLALRVEEACARGARLVVCPEMATSGYVFESAEEIRPFCEEAKGPTFQALAPIAARHQAIVVCGYAERAAEGLFNSALMIGPQGNLIASYRKVLLYFADETWARAGARRMLVQMEAGLLAPGICMDLNDPGFTSFIEREAPSIVAFCTNWVDEGEEVLPYWRERLGKWRGTFVAADRWGEERGTRFYGRSCILGPDGQVLAMAAPEGDEVLTAEIRAAGAAAPAP